MSLIQGIIGSAVQVTPALTYPTPGSNYPSGSYTLNAGITATATGYYPWQQFQTTNPIDGLWRRTYTGMALDGTNGDLNFPTGYTQVESMLDAAVGFGYAPDSATSYTMEWLGYFAPESDGDFTFGVNQVDDYMMMWIGAEAVSGFDNTNYLFKGSGGQSSSPKIALLTGRYYPVRIRYTEGSGGNEFSFVSGLNNTIMTNNNVTGRAGYFKTDNNTFAGSFPSTGLVTG